MSLVARVIARMNAAEDRASSDLLLPKDRGMTSVFGARRSTNLGGPGATAGQAESARTEDATTPLRRAASGRDEEPTDDVTAAPIRRVSRTEMAPQKPADGPSHSGEAAGKDVVVHRQAEPDEEETQAHRQAQSETNEGPALGLRSAMEDATRAEPLGPARRVPLSAQREAAAPRRQTTGDDEEPVAQAARAAPAQMAARDIVPPAESEAMEEQTAPELRHEDPPDMALAKRFLSHDTAAIQVTAPAPETSAGDSHDVPAETPIAPPPLDAAVVPEVLGTVTAQQDRPQVTVSDRPKVLIDQIDVVVAAPEPSSNASPATSRAGELLARRWLRR